MEFDKWGLRVGLYSYGLMCGLVLATFQNKAHSNVHWIFPVVNWVGAMVYWVNVSRKRKRERASENSICSLVSRHNNNSRHLRLETKMNLEVEETRHTFYLVSCWTDDAQLDGQGPRNKSWSLSPLGNMRKKTLFWPWEWSKFGTILRTRSICLVHNTWLNVESLLKSLLKSQKKILSLTVKHSNLFWFG